MAKKRNWDLLRNQSPEESVQYRDVYEDQQLVRKGLGEKQTPTSRLVFTGVVAVLTAVFVYCVASVFLWGMSSMKASGMFPASSPAEAIGATMSDTDGSKGDTDSGEAIGDSGNSSAGSSETQSTMTAYEYEKAYLSYVPGDPTLVQDEFGNQYPYSQINAMCSTGLPPAEAWAKLQGGSDGSVPGAVVPDADAPETAVSESDGSESGASQTEANKPVESAATDSGAGSSKDESAKTDIPSIGYYFSPLRGWNVLAGLLGGLMVGLVLGQYMMRNLDAQNAPYVTDDLNQHKNDQHIALPEEVMQKFDWFPDVGAHSHVQVSSMISHVAVMNKGIKKVQVTRRAKKDILDEDGDVLYYKGEALTDDDGNLLVDTKPMFDDEFADALFTASKAPKGKKYRKRYDLTAIKYNPGDEDREKQRGYDTVADLVNGDWVFPDYEPQRPGGAYLVDVAPVNTMVLAISKETA